MSPEDYMKEALLEAQKAFDIDEIPVGAVIVKDGRIIGRGYNKTESTKDPTAHAEMLAIQEAAATVGGWRLTGCSLYVTLEPCSMCAGAIILSRLDKLYIGTMDPKAGATGSLMNIPQDRRLNHYVEIETDVLKHDCEQLMKQFFKKIRNRPGRKNT
jgi:tRNA(adenine34) deaminase